jgi:hypothetical protein
VCANKINTDDQISESGVPDATADFRRQQEQRRVGRVDNGTTRERQL